jgi:tRNA-Thr(GGU) m(6)t(6)A37 methyltransferase TsaA
MNESVIHIGVVHSELKRLEDCPRQEREDAPAAVVEVFDEFSAGAKDIKAGESLILFTWLHQSDRSALTTHPRNNPKASITGVFSTRSPDRPNPIGMHHVKVTSILAKNKFQVDGLEVLDQTPIIDIKPDLQ